ncbi:MULTISPECIES: methionine ABC transporter ATP-binding protein [Actinomycetaceae]|uniref:methionine ABC transporter ATP-binding protein n=1 Tax=Actinomycetaceae TaxID=2049 RepID=UPI0003967091|nr:MULTISPECIES: ATP-binding cassette domain-containing protein [Actinomycetaceae]ERH29029.1 ABC transporter, ATP-binding protein [Actinomyces sp. oral taxon 172 str. F0311]WLD78212.1 ATP-binding cassette domain-containing protein [Schaalia sp. HMT-172]
MIDLTGVSKVYPVKNGGQVVALDGVNLHVDRGSIHGIVGRSGAGKSTLIRCLTALEKPTEGSIVVDGLDLATLSGARLRAARRHIGMVFQAANLLDARTAAENIGYPLKLAGVPAAKRRARVDELLELVGLTGRGDSYPSQLSGGQRQRVGIARALADNPGVLLCDEPTSALDTESTAQILSLLRLVRDVSGVTVVIITHEMSVVREICDSVTLLGHGQVLQTGTLEEVVADPATPLARELVPMPVVDSIPSLSSQERSYGPGADAGVVLLDVVFTSHPGVPTGATVLRLASSMGADVTAGTFESLGSVQVGRLALTVPAYHADKIIEQLRKNNVHAEVRDQ